jgi:hypothetical protein
MIKLAISEAQFDELSDAGKEQYKDWCVAHGLEVTETGVEDGEKIEYDIPLWEIGELIAFLYEHGVFVGNVLSPNFNDVTVWCDKLWTKVKPILDQPMKTI